MLVCLSVYLTYNNIFIIGLEVNEVSDPIEVLTNINLLLQSPCKMGLLYLSITDNTWVPSALIMIDFTLSMWPLSFITFEQVRGSHTLRICQRRSTESSQVQIYRLAEILGVNTVIAIVQMGTMMSVGQIFS